MDSQVPESCTIRISDYPPKQVFGGSSNRSWLKSSSGRDRAGVPERRINRRAETLTDVAALALSDVRPKIKILQYF